MHWPPSRLKRGAALQRPRSDLSWIRSACTNIRDALTRTEQAVEHGNQHSQPSGNGNVSANGNSSFWTRDAADPDASFHLLGEIVASNMGPPSIQPGADQLTVQLGDHGDSHDQQPEEDTAMIGDGLEFVASPTRESSAVPDPGRDIQNPKSWPPQYDQAEYVDDDAASHAGSISAMSELEPELESDLEPDLEPELDVESDVADSSDSPERSADSNLDLSEGDDQVELDEDEEPVGSMPAKEEYEDLLDSEEEHAGESEAASESESESEGEIESEYEDQQDIEMRFEPVPETDEMALDPLGIEFHGPEADELGTFVDSPVDIEDVMDELSEIDQSNGSDDDVVDLEQDDPQEADNAYDYALQALNQTNPAPTMGYSFNTEPIAANILGDNHPDGLGELQDNLVSTNAAEDIFDNLDLAQYAEQAIKAEEPHDSEVESLSELQPTAVEDEADSLKVDDRPIATNAPDFDSVYPTFSIQDSPSPNADHPVETNTETNAFGELIKSTVKPTAMIEETAEFSEKDEAVKALEVADLQKEKDATASGATLNVYAGIRELFDVGFTIAPDYAPQTTGTRPQRALGSLTVGQAQLGVLPAEQNAVLVDNAKALFSQSAIFGGKTLRRPELPKVFDLPSYGPEMTEQAKQLFAFSPAFGGVAPAPAAPAVAEPEPEPEPEPMQETEVVQVRSPSRRRPSSTRPSPTKTSKAAVSEPVRVKDKSKSVNSRPKTKKADSGTALGVTAQADGETAPGPNVSPEEQASVTSPDAVDLPLDSSPRHLRRSSRVADVRPEPSPKRRRVSKVSAMEPSRDDNVDGAAEPVDPRPGNGLETATKMVSNSTNSPAKKGRKEASESHPDDSPRSPSRAGRTNRVDRVAKDTKPQPPKSPKKKLSSTKKSTKKSEQNSAARRTLRNGKKLP